MPWAMAFLAAPSAAICAAKGVLLRDPLNPTLPALPQVPPLPVPSVMVTMVLLTLPWMQAPPWVTPFPSFLLGRAPAGRLAGVAILSSPQYWKLEIGNRKLETDQSAALHAPHSVSPASSFQFPASSF